MPKQYTGNYIVRWIVEGKEKSKTYTSWALAQKAARWLSEQGIDSVDVAVEVEKSIAGE